MTAPQPKTTTYLARGGDAITVSGFAFTGDPRGGSLSAHGKATGEAFWPVGAVLADYLCWDCPLLAAGDATERKRVVELGCGLGLCGLVAASRLHGAGDRVQLTDGSAAVVSLARAACATLAAAHGTAAPVRASVLRWGDAATIRCLNAAGGGGGGGGGGGNEGWGAALPALLRRCCCAPARGGGGACPPGCYDLVIASDILYDPRLAVPAAARLAATADALLVPEAAAGLPVRGASPPALWHRWTDQSLGPSARAAGGERARPMVVVAFQRRSVALAVLEDAFAAAGFEMHRPTPGNADDADAPEGYVSDLFANRSEGTTDLWDQQLCCFTRCSEAAAPVVVAAPLLVAPPR